MREYPRQSWINSRVERRASLIAGSGTFASEPIAAGEVVFVFGGALATLEEIAAGKLVKDTYVNVEENLYIGHSPEMGIAVDDYLNHSCDPNIWMADEVTLVARRPIAAGEEVLVDYVMYSSSDWVGAWTCHCGSPDCRKQILGTDWQLPELQARYCGHFSPFIERKIAAWQLESIAAGRVAQRAILR